MATVTYVKPTWETIQSLSPSNTVSGVSSTSLGYQGTLDSVTAFQFCQEFGYSLVGYQVGSPENPTVTYDETSAVWEDDTSEPVYLQIQCDNGLTESIGEVNIANIGDLMVILSVLVCAAIIQVFLLTFGRN